MSVVHFLNVLEGDCNIIQHDTGRISVIDVSNAYNENETEAEKKAKYIKDTVFKARTHVPADKINFGQKKDPDNPIRYLKDNMFRDHIFRFIITHPDMDHIDGIRDFFETIGVDWFWDTNNNKVLDSFGGGYNEDDWKFYLDIRNKVYRADNRRNFVSGDNYNYFDEDLIKILAPNQALINEANNSKNYNDSSFVLLYTPPKKGGGHWKLLFASDSHDKTWEYILGNEEYRKLISDTDVLFAPHHGRDSNRSYDFLSIVKPKVTLLGNASAEHLAYGKYPPIRITNNQAGYIIMDINTDRIKFFVKNREFANHFRRRRNQGDAPLDKNHKAFELGLDL